MLVLDANILVRAVLGQRVRNILINYGESVQFFTPDVAFADARKHLPRVLTKRGIPVEPAMTLLESLHDVIQTVERHIYFPYEGIALKRLLRRDPNDWPVLATALALNFAIWTEDTDFFGTGIATWTTDRVELFLRRSTG